MPIYAVTIQASIAKTYEIEASTKESAYEYAHERFNSEPDTNGTYGDEVIDCRLIEPEFEPTAFVVSNIAELRDVLFDLRGKILQADLCVQVDNTGKITIEPVKG